MDLYTIKDFRVGNFEDTNGNTWCQLAVEEYGEPLIWVVKDPEKTPERFALGTRIYGEIKDWTSSKGKTSPRYYDHTKDQDSPKSSSKPKSDLYLKDVTDIPVRFMLHCLQYFDAQTLSSNKTQYATYLELVQMLSEDALLMIDNIRSGSGEGTVNHKPSTSPSPTIKEGKPAATLSDKWKETKAPKVYDSAKEAGYTDDDIPPEFL